LCTVVKKTGGQRIETVRETAREGKVRVGNEKDDKIQG
jgi:hypothetical protein